MTDDDYDALSQKQLASIKRDMRISLEDAAVRATYKVMAELAQPEQEPVATIRTWHKFGDQHAELLDWKHGLVELPDGEHTLYTHPQPAQPAQPAQPKVEQGPVAWNLKDVTDAYKLGAKSQPKEQA